MKGENGMEGQATILTQFEVVAGGMCGGVMMETKSFAEAIAYAHSNEWDVFSVEKKCLIYDGARDEFFT